MPTIATVLTLGYEKRSIQEYIRLLCEARVDVVVDVRETAWSHKPGFSKSKLQACLRAAGIEYIHARVAGNPKSLRRAATSHAECLERFTDHLDAHPDVETEFDLILSICLVREQRVCLLCFERHHDDCHRGILAERWARRHHGQVKHLAPHGCNRMIPA